jgi:diguanylate cyclase (GGDEF)-like protein/PAS domain S-box-containing protein
MYFVNLSFIVLLIITSFLAISFTWVAIRSRQVLPGGIAVVLIGCSVAIWSLGYLAEILVTPIALKIIFANLKQFGNMLLPAAFLIFALRYGHYVQKIKGILIAFLFIEPLVVLYLYWFNDLHGLMRVNPHLISSGILIFLDFQFGIGLYLHFTYCAILTLIGAILLLVRFFNARSYFRNQLFFILIGMAIPFFGAFFNVIGLIPAFYDTTPLLLGISFPLMAYGLFRNQFFNLVPIDNQSILDNIPYGLIVLKLSPEEQISAINPKAAEILNVSREQAVGHAVSKFINSWQFFPQDNKTETSFGLDWSGRFFNVICYPVSNARETITYWLILFHDLTEERRLEETLHASEIKYRTLVERSTDGIAILQNQIIRYCNPQLSSMVGYPVEALTGYSIERLLTEETKSLTEKRNSFLTCSEDFDSFFETILVHHDGSQVPVEISIAPIPYENEDALLVITRDITQRKKQQADREKTMALLQATIEHANSGILVIDAQQNVLAHNRKFLEIWKMPADWARIPSALERAEYFFHNSINVLESRKSADNLIRNLEIESQKQLNLNDGRTLDRYTCPFRVSGELVGRLYIYQDITEQIQNQSRLQASEEKYRLIADNASDVIWTTDYEGNFTYVSPSVEKLRGFTVEEVLNQTLEEALTPESYQQVNKAILQLKKSIHENLSLDVLVLSSRNRFNLEQPCKDGSAVWTEVETSLLVNQSRQIVGIQGVSRDITERRLNEKALEEARNLAEQRSLEAQEALLREKQLHAITRTISSSMEIDTILSDLLHQTLDITRGDEAHMGLMSDDGLSILFQYGMNRQSTFLLDDVVPRDLSYLSWQIVDRRKGILLGPVELQDNKNIFKNDLERIGAVSFLGVPVMAGLVVLGVLGIFSTDPVNLFTEHDLAMMESVGSQAGIAIQNARLFSEVNLLAVTDPLTRLYNRRYFFNLARVELERARRYGHELSIIMMDIDFFKRVNDSYGHLAGDEALVSMTDCINANLRQIDLAARYGGEEFVILLPETDLSAAKVTAERLRKSIDDMRVPFNGDSISITVSVGVSGYMGQTEIDVSKLLDQADKALYTAKEKGRNTVIAWTDI